MKKRGTIRMGVILKAVARAKAAAERIMRSSKYATMPMVQSARMTIVSCPSEMASWMGQKLYAASAKTANSKLRMRTRNIRASNKTDVSIRARFKLRHRLAARRAGIREKGARRSARRG